jgi:hypothetical protein
MEMPKSHRTEPDKRLGRVRHLAKLCALAASMGLGVVLGVAATPVGAPSTSHTALQSGALALAPNSQGGPWVP